MKVKAVAWLELGVILVLVALLAPQCVLIGGDKPVVREPLAPGESTLEYEPPPAPKFTTETLKQLPKLMKNFRPAVDKITDDIYLARGYALGNVIMVITDEGLVIVDTTESEESAREIERDFRKITDKPVKYIIYTHSHLDHVNGARVFMNDDTEIIATNAAVRQMDRDYVEFGEFQARSRANQAGRAAPEYSREMPFESPVRVDNFRRDFPRPTITFDEEYNFELGGKRFELYHTTGETHGHLMVWIPDEKALFPGDLYYMSFPNLSTPMLEPRPVKGWYESLDRMIPFNAEYLVPSHTEAIIGADNVRKVLTDHSAAIKYVYDETVKCINEGKSVEEAVATVKLPPELAGRFHLQEYYGRVDWSVRGIYQAETGWYDGHGTNLAPLPPKNRAAELVSIAGGADKILARAIELQKAGEHQLVCELCDVVINANPDDKLAHIIKANSLEYLGYGGGNLNMFGFYRSAAALERQAAGVKP